MNKNDIYEKVKKYLINDLLIEEEKIYPEADLFIHVGLESVERMDLIEVLNAELHYEIEESELAKIFTVQDLVDYIYAHLSKRKKI